MPALDNDSTINQCELLNKKAFPTLLISSSASDDVAIPAIVRNGSLVKFSDAIKGLSADQAAQNILDTIQNSDSTPSLIQFLSGKGVANAEGIPSYSKLNNVLLSSGTLTGSSSGTSYESIVDNYFVGSGRLTGASYTFSTTDAPIITRAMLWNPADADSKQPSSILGNLINRGYLLSSKELFNPNDFDPKLAIPPAKTESLLYLQSLHAASQIGLNVNSSTTAGTTTTITTEQQNRRALLEARNLRFFGAWLVEYCFYRSRYEWLLKKYFAVYTDSKYISPNISTNTTLQPLFLGQKATNPAPNQYSSPQLSQAEYLRCLVFHMACLNTRMVDMRMLMGSISEYYSAVQVIIQKAVNDDSRLGSNKDMTDKITMLNDSAAAVQEYVTERDFREGVMEYNLEKNRYANILLGLYAFLNIVAVAMIVQIRKS